MRAFIYCRVSTREQSLDDHYSLDNQEAHAREYARSRKWTVAKVRKDVGSGKNDAREGFQELRADIAAGRIDVLIVYRLDRLSRNVRDIYDTLEALREQDIAFVSVTEGFDTTTAMGRAMLGVAAVFAQLTREMIAENVKDGLARRAEAGFYRGNLKMIYGYDWDPETRNIAINETEAAVVRRIFAWVAEHKWGPFRIARVLNVECISGKSGGQWNQTMIRWVLGNPVHCGMVRCNGGLIEGRHQAIISRETYDTAWEVLHSRSQLPARAQNSPHLLSGLACCGNCGRRLRAYYGPAAKATGRRYLFYAHRATTKAGEPECKGIFKSSEALEQAVVSELGRIATSGEMLEAILSDAASRAAESAAPLQEERDRLLSEMDEINQRFTDWAQRLDRGLIDEEQFAQQNQALLARKASARKRLDTLDVELGRFEGVEVTLEEVRRALADFPAVWGSLDLDEQRETLRLLVESLGVFSTHAELKVLFMEPVAIPLGLKRGRRPQSESIG